MDSRITIGSHETFLPMLKEARERKEKLNLILDNEGLERLEGYISSVVEEEGVVFLLMDSGRKIPLSQVVGLNGVFLPDYGEC